MLDERGVTSPPYRPYIYIYIDILIYQAPIELSLTNEVSLSKW